MRQRLTVAAISVACIVGALLGLTIVGKVLGFFVLLLVLVLIVGVIALFALLFLGHNDPDAMAAADRRTGELQSTLVNEWTKWPLDDEH